MYYYVIIILCQHGGIGRRTGLKIQRWQHRAGSTPAAGIYNLNIFEVYFFYISLLDFNSLAKEFEGSYYEINNK